jgi:hypothetical protein
VGTLDRRKLAAPVFAQAAAFIVVFVIGVLSGPHGTSASEPPHTPAPTPTQPTQHVTVSPPGSATRQLSALTVEVFEGTASVPGIPVQVLKALTMTSEASGITTQGSPGIPTGMTTDVDVGDYQICVRPPAGWTFTGQNTDVLPGSDCSLVHVGLPVQIAQFRFIRGSKTTGAGL